VVSSYHEWNFPPVHCAFSRARELFPQVTRGTSKAQHASKTGAFTKMGTKAQLQISIRHTATFSFSFSHTLTGNQQRWLKATSFSIINPIFSLHTPRQ
jgi:hypothetical protein